MLFREAFSVKVFCCAFSIVHIMHSMVGQSIPSIYNLGNIRIYWGAKSRGKYVASGRIYQIWTSLLYYIYILHTRTHTYIYLYTWLDKVILTSCVCLCGATPNVALVHSILEHQTRGSVVGVGGQVVNRPLSSICCVDKWHCANVAWVLFGCECAIHFHHVQSRRWLGSDV